jgi:hypothetical protein
MFDIIWKLRLWVAGYSVKNFISSEKGVLLFSDASPFSTF